MGAAEESGFPRPWARSLAHLYGNWGDRQIHPEKLNITGKVRNKQVGYRPCHWSPQRPRRNSTGLCSEFKQFVTCSVFSITHTNRDRCQERKGGKYFRCSWNKYNMWLMREKRGNQRTWENRRIRNYEKRGREGGSEEESVKGTFQLDLRSSNPYSSLMLRHNACVIHLTASLTLYCHMSL